jgi:hypothetical protein
VLQVDGWLVEAEAGELVHAVDELGTSVVLDLAELRRADRPSLEILRGLNIRGIELRRLSPLIQAQLGSSAGSGAIRRDEPECTGEA